MSDGIPRAITLTIKNKEGFPISSTQQKGNIIGPHNFCHPIHQFNNLGVLHLKMKKYTLALSYFQNVKIIQKN